MGVFVGFLWSEYSWELELFHMVVLWEERILEIRKILKRKIRTDKIESRDSKKLGE